MAYLADLETMVRTQIRDLVPIAWAVSTSYVLGTVVANAGFVYQCTSAGTSAASGTGPEGLLPTIDGTVSWAYLKPVWAPAFQNAEIDQYIYDAIAQYSRYRGRKRPFTLNIVSGQSQYALPVDWISADLRSLDRARNPHPNMDAGSPYAWSFDTVMVMPPNLGLRGIRFDFYDSDQTLVLTPTPMASYTLVFDYEALHQVTASTASAPQICTIPAQNQYIAMYWASAQALFALAVDQGGRLQNYKVNNAISVDNTNIVKSLQQSAQQFQSEWTAFLADRPMGISGGDTRGMPPNLNFSGFGWGW